MDTYIEPVIQMVEPEHYEMLARFLMDNNDIEIIRKFNPFPLNRETAYQIACKSHLDRYYIAHSNNRIVGLCMLRGWDEGYPIPSFGVLVDCQFKHRGVGTKLTKFAIDEARNLGCDLVRLSVFASNESALRIYTSLGFIEKERENVQVMGEPDERIVMFKKL